MRCTRFSGVIAVLGVCLLMGVLATQAMAQDGAQTQATAGKARLQAKAMTDEQMDQVTAGGFSYGVDKIVQGAVKVADGCIIGGLFKIGFGTKIIIKSTMPPP